MNTADIKHKLTSNMKLSKTYIFLLLSVCILVFTILFSTFSQTSTLTTLLTQSYATQMESVCKSNEQFINVLSSSLNMASDDKAFMQILTNTGNAVTTQDYIHASQILRQARRNSSEYVDSIIMVDRQNAVVCGTGVVGAVPVSDFFQNSCTYDSYDADYWLSYTNALSAHKVLPMTKVSFWDDEKYIIPIVFSKINSLPIYNPIIVNIDVSKLISSLSMHQLTKNTVFGIAGKQSQICYFQNGEPQQLDSDFIEKISQKSMAEFETELNGVSYTAIAYSPYYSVLGYTYVSLVPKRDILNLTFALQASLIIVFILALITLAVIIRFLVHSIREPYKLLASLFDSTEEMSDKSPTVLLKYLSSSINNIVSTNKALSSQVSKIRPLENQQYLIDLLNTNMRYITPDETDVLREHIPELKYDYFCSIIISFELSGSFYDMYNSFEYGQIKSGISKIIYGHFSDKFVTYTLPSSNNTYYILLNLENPEMKDDILALLESFETLFRQDREYINISVGAGNIYPYADGLIRSHKEAVDALSVTNTAQVIVETNPTTSYSFTISDENAIFNYLLSGKTDMAISEINRVIDKNNSFTTNNNNICRLYIQIINTVFKVMRLKNINYDTENCGDLVLLNKIISLPPEEIYGMILKYIDEIKLQTQNSGRVDINAVIAYMQSHFQEDLYLDTVAEVFATTSKYLSKKIKAELDVSFTEYLTFLRIEKAKELLEADEMNITDIYLAVGYNNRNTFIRCFKNYTGLTPSDYKKQLHS